MGLRWGGLGGAPRPWGGRGGAPGPPPRFSWPPSPLSLWLLFWWLLLNTLWSLSSSSSAFGWSLSEAWSLSISGCSLPFSSCNLSLSGYNCALSGCSLSLIAWSRPFSGWILPFSGWILPGSGCSLSFSECSMPPSGDDEPDPDPPRLSTSRDLPPGLPSRDPGLSHRSGDSLCASRPSAGSPSMPRLSLTGADMSLLSGFWRESFLHRRRPCPVVRSMMTVRWPPATTGQQPVSPTTDRSEVLAYTPQNTLFHKKQSALPEFTKCPILFRSEFDPLQFITTFFYQFRCKYIHEREKVKIISSL